MRNWFALLLVGPVICVGCAGVSVSSKPPAPASDETAVGGPSPPPEQKAEPRRDPTKRSELIVTIENSVTGKVVRYNDAGRFVVLDFPLGRTPAADQRMFVYRRGLKVGEVKISVWQRENLIVADVTAGEAAAGDEVRNK